MALPKPDHPVTIELLSLQMAHLQQTMNEERDEARAQRLEVREVIKEHAVRIRSIEDDRIRAWTIIGLLTALGLSGVVLIAKALIAG